LIASPVILPATCDLDVSDAKFAAAAAQLRAHPDLVGELRWHRASVSAFMADYGTVDQQTRKLQDAIGKAAA